MNEDTGCPPHCCCDCEICCDCGERKQPIRRGELSKGWAGESDGPDDEETSAMPEERVVPNRLSVDPASDYYDKDAIPGLHVFIDGKEVRNVVEYCMSGRWARIYQVDGRGKPKRERGKLVAI